MIWKTLKKEAKGKIAPKPKKVKNIGCMTIEDLREFQAEVREYLSDIDTAGPVIEGVAAGRNCSKEVAERLALIWNKHPKVRQEMNSKETPEEVKTKPFKDITDRGLCFRMMTCWVPKFATNGSITPQEFYTQANILRLSLYECDNDDFFNSMIGGVIEPGKDGEWVGCTGTKFDKLGRERPKFKFNQAAMDFLKTGKLIHKVDGKELTMQVILGMPEGVDNVFSKAGLKVGLAILGLNTCQALSFDRSGVTDLYRAIEVATRPEAGGNGLNIPLELGYRINSSDSVTRRDEINRLCNDTITMFENAEKAYLEWSIVDPQGLNPPRIPGGKQFFNISKIPIAGEITKYGLDALPDDHRLQKYKGKKQIPLHEYWAYDFFMQHCFRGGFLPRHMDDNGYTETPEDMLRKFEEKNPDDLKDLADRGVTKDQVENFIAHGPAYAQVLALLIRKHFVIGPANFAIIIAGDKGTGKTLAVNWLICMRYECESLEALRIPSPTVDIAFGPLAGRTTGSVSESVFKGDFNNYAHYEVTRLEEFTSLKYLENHIKEIATSFEGRKHLKGKEEESVTNTNLITGTTNDLINVELKENNRKIHFFNPQDLPSEMRKMLAHIRREISIGNISKDLWNVDVPGASAEGAGRVEVKDSVFAQMIGSSLSRDVTGQDRNVGLLVKRFKDQFEAWYCINHQVSDELFKNFSNVEGIFDVGDVKRTPFAAEIEGRGTYGSALLKACAEASLLDAFINKNLTDINTDQLGEGTTVLGLIKEYNECNNEIPLDLLRRTWEHIRQKDNKQLEQNLDNSKQNFRKMVINAHLKHRLRERSETIEVGGTQVRQTKEWLEMDGFGRIRKATLGMGVENKIPNVGERKVEAY